MLLTQRKETVMARRSVAAMACGLLLVVTPGLRAGDQVFDSNGVKIRYTDEGKGEPVLLIHGFGANREVQWAVPGVLGTLAKDYRVIAYDNRGHGRSGKPHEPERYGTEMVEDAVRLLDHLKIKKAHVIGYSMGAMITGKLMVAHPDRLRTAVLGGAAPVYGDALPPQFVDQLAASLDKGQGIGMLLEALTPPGKPKLTADQIKVTNAMFTAFNDQKALAAVVRGWRELRVSDADLKANQISTLALIGGDDPLLKSVEGLRGRMSHLKIVVIPGADHVTAFSRPQFVQELKEFLDKHRAAKPARPGPER
jgi:pimeloyl-ACP methyl ester carboxylesterase